VDLKEDPRDAGKGIMASADLMCTEKKEMYFTWIERQARHKKRISCLSIL
jgi:hypothetical protein